MRGARVAVLVALVALLAVRPVSAGGERPAGAATAIQSSPNSGGPTIGPWFGQAAKPAAPPRSLFTTPLPGSHTVPSSAVVRGMTLLPADPGYDPKIRRAAPASGPSFTLKTIEPQTCRR